MSEYACPTIPPSRPCRRLGEGADARRRAADHEVVEVPPLETLNVTASRSNSLWKVGAPVRSISPSARHSAAQVRAMQFGVRLPSAAPTARARRARTRRPRPGGTEEVIDVDAATRHLQSSLRTALCCAPPTAAAVRRVRPRGLEEASRSGAGTRQRGEAHEPAVAERPWQTSEGMRPSTNTWYESPRSRDALHEYCRGSPSYPGAAPPCTPFSAARDAVDALRLRAEAEVDEQSFASDARRFASLPRTASRAGSAGARGERCASERRGWRARRRASRSPPCRAARRAACCTSDRSRGVDEAHRSSAGRHLDLLLLRLLLRRRVDQREVRRVGEVDREVDLLERRHLSRRRR